jgi:hypothetical protein
VRASTFRNVAPVSSTLTFPGIRCDCISASAA